MPTWHRHLITLQTVENTLWQKFLSTVKLRMVAFCPCNISTSQLLTTEKFRCGSTYVFCTHTPNINYLRRMPFIINYILLWHLRCTSLSPWALRVRVNFYRFIVSIFAPVPKTFNRKQNVSIYIWHDIIPQPLFCFTWYLIYVCTTRQPESCCNFARR